MPSSESDYPRVSFYAGCRLPYPPYPHVNLCRYRHWDGTLWFSIETGNARTRTGQYNSLALDGAGNPHISYYDDCCDNLKYARWDGSRWIIETIHSTGMVGNYASHMLDQDGNAHISSDDSTYGDLRYATGSVAGE